MRSNLILKALANGKIFIAPVSFVFPKKALLSENYLGWSGKPELMIIIQIIFL
jgi:hypothetical protein